MFTTFQYGNTRFRIKLSKRLNDLDFKKQTKNKTGVSCIHEMIKLKKVSSRIYFKAKIVPSSQTTGLTGLPAKIKIVKRPENF